MWDPHFGAYKKLSMSPHTRYIPMKKTRYLRLCELQGGGSLRCPGAGGWGGLCCALCSCVAVGRRARDRSLVRVPRGDSYVYVCVYGSVYVYERFWCRSLCEYSTRSLQVIKMWLLNGPTGHFPFRGPSWLVLSSVLFRRTNRTNLHSAGRGRAQTHRL
jgi:hypothetical protein